MSSSTTGASEKTLFIDNRERSGLETAVQRYCDKEKIPWEMKQSLIADYTYGQFGIEAKSIQDYFQSLHSGKLRTQLENLDDNFNRFALVIHGKVESYVSQIRNRGRKTSYASAEAQFIGSLARFDVDFDLTIMHFPTSSAAARWIVKRCQKDGTLGRTNTYRAMRRTSSEDVRVDALRGAGCSEAIAKRLLEEFGSLAELAGATVPELMRLEGIGKVRAKQIVKVFNSESSVVKEKVKLTNA